ncbi:hypothetical protein ZEAMMB73_Zm00001d037393 [Zea mays]|uniref:Uncharacterized protein n=1 Tax=Zea mays TaxID=4577 RepID=A0A1D6LXG7_MAIZE|nr:hypothetical protein ZEAMMB73_Zm00001d037393 [Zea mays]AQK83879.1 hypothetical protein ZEAMMB73_Zm00001d037393 [Zea mays]AQK83881.1 hypothetical protein ZEAMMB73_Zm00001d037393 [Zea mays]
MSSHMTSFVVGFIIEWRVAILSLATTCACQLCLATFNEGLCWCCDKDTCQEQYGCR